MSWVLWGSELSPFALKVEALLRFAGLPYRWLPRDGGFREALRFALRRQRIVSGRLPLTWPRRSELDEFPQVPFLFGPGGENLYDSSAIGAWLDRERSTLGKPRALLIPDDPELARTVRLIDEALDEVGLYLVHHNRWVVAARDNDAGTRLAREFRPLLGPAARLLARRFPARQVRRLPYLLSVAAPDARGFEGLPPALRPPARAGFPPTHALLERIFRRLLAALEPLFEKQPYLLGARFTLADASVYGQLGMNLSDASASAWIERLAPRTHAWLVRIAQGDSSAHRHDAVATLGPALTPLLDWIDQIFVPLMQQNADAYARHRAAGETLFNEAAFDAGRALYEGTLLGQPFRSVAKSFQVQVWHGLNERGHERGRSLKS